MLAERAADAFNGRDVHIAQLTAVPAGISRQQNLRTLPFARRRLASFDDALQLQSILSTQVDAVFLGHAPLSPPPSCFSPLDLAVMDQ